MVSPKKPPFAFPPINGHKRRPGSIPKTAWRLSAQADVHCSNRERPPLVDSRHIHEVIGNGGNLMPTAKSPTLNTGPDLDENLPSLQTSKSRNLRPSLFFCALLRRR